MPLVSTFGAAASRGFGLFSAPAAVLDDYFEYVTLLLPGNGTNGAQNNTFLDSSTNNFTITRNGNTTQGTFSPYGDNWSNYFDGAGDYLSVAANAALAFGTGNFTIEGWFYLSATAENGLFNSTNSSTGANGIAAFLRTDNILQFSNYATVFLTSSALTTNSWHHYAIVRSGTTLSMFVDGARTSTTTNSTSFTSNIALDIGRTGLGNINGYQSNLRMVKGTAVYDPTLTTLTVPTSPLTAITNTSLLTCQSNRFIDNSTNAFTITVNGNTSVQRFSPFSPSASYSAATIGGSGYFDGTGDYLRYATNTSSQFSLGTADFTDEVWVFPTAFAAGSTVISSQTQTSGEAAYSYALYLDSTGRPGVLAAASSGGYGVNFLGTAIPLNAWTHLAVTRSGNTFTLWRNGVSDGTATSTVSIFQDTASGYGGWNIGGSPQTGQNHNGYISNSRLVKGTAVYTAAFTPPTSPLTAITNTSLLLNFTNAGIIDNAMMNDLETVGNAQISTTQSKFGGGSMYFDGTGDWLVTTTSPNYAFGTSDWTIEFWVNSTQTSRVDPIGWNYSFSSAGWAGVILNVAASGQMSWYETSNQRINATSTGWNNGAWNHIAVSRSGNSVRMFLNGTQVGSTYTTSFSYGVNGTNVYGMIIGINNDGTGPFNGYIDDLRITKGVARYTANFTPPTAAFPTR